MSQRLTRKEIKRDQVQETLTDVMGYLRENVRSLLLLLGLILLSLAAFGGYRTLSERKQNEANELLAEALRVYSAPITESPDPTSSTEPSFADVASRDAQARQRLENVISEFGHSDAAAVASAYLGELEARDGNLDGARALWEEFLDSQGNHMLAAEVRVNLMSLDRAQGRGQELAAQIRALLEEPEPPLPKDVLLYQLALTQGELGLEGEARETMQRILDEVPQSVYAAEARAELGADELTSALGGF
jgi:tetratricopeptide (TPR) repeat protein